MRLSRYQPKSLKLHWYEPTMQPAAFHIGDVERLQDYLRPSPQPTLGMAAGMAASGPHTTTY